MAEGEGGEGRAARGGWRRWLRRLGFVAAALALAAVVAALALTRDPRPRFAERHGAIAEVERQGVEPAGAGEVVQRVRVVADTGLAVELAVRRPEHDDGTPRPLIVLLGGHETGRDAVDLLESTRGTIVAALAYPYDGPRKPKGLRAVAAVPAIRRALLDTPPAIQLALDWLLTEPGVDPQAVELVGVSLGAPFACIAGALDERFCRVWSIHGAADPYALLDAGLERRIDFGPARALVAGAAYVAACGPHLDPAGWIGEIAPRPVVLVNASDDERLPRDAVAALHAAAREPVEFVWTAGAHVEPDRATIVRGLVDLVLDRVAR